ncbi:MAG TPA: hypothetical protein DCQ92_15590 [Verrucomicrobia subdivision 3 bacterium]|nr:hypothetical protein [Limisphaerales bacterium]
MVRGRCLDVIDEHNKLFDKASLVGVGKYGIPWQRTRCSEFNNAINSGVTTYLFIVLKTANGFKGFRAPIRMISLSGNLQDLALKYPEYYNEYRRVPMLYDAVLTVEPSMWFVISSRLEPHSLARLRLLSNNRRLLDVLSKPCRSSAMIVLEGKKPH